MTTTCIDEKIEPLTMNERSIYVYNETNRKISRLDRIDKKLMKNKRTNKNEKFQGPGTKKIRKGRGRGKPADSDIFSSVYAFVFVFLSHLHTGTIRI